MAKRTGLGRVVWIVAIAGGVVFAVQGGEYTTADLVRQHFAQKRLEREIDSLRALNDSLGRELHAVKTDPETQERIAREEFGMVRGDREILYRFAETRDTAAAGR